MNWERGLTIPVPYTYCFGDIYWRYIVLKMYMFILAFLVRSTNCRWKNVRTCFFWTIEFIKGIRFSNHVSGALHTSYFHQCRCKLQRNIWNYHPILIKLRKKSKYIEMLKKCLKKDEEISNRKFRREIAQSTSKSNYIKVHWKYYLIYHFI